MAFQFKNWSQDDEWLPSPSDEPIEIFKLDVNGKQLEPHGVPGFVEPDFERKQNLSDIKNNISKNNGMLLEGEQQWWDSFFKDPHSTCCHKIQWYLLSLTRDVPQEPSTM